MPLSLRKSTLNVMEEKDVLSKMNFTQPYIGFLAEEEIRG